ncbi:hypothetical protein Clacol_001695 [Clathrus columnatus]|uniref:Protein EFR3 n=1 Tax=Clathrus columnatus TaxID=1419009 RepID=A0AAV5A2Q1_9AGAM|nr:hypothetical protein Clacol_001695 [Clathrus columnatus]
MRSPFTAYHVKLLQACYPPSSVLLSTGSECSPNSQELSRLTYFGTNNPAKLTKLGSELERRCRLEANRARTGNVKARTSLLLSLNIFKTLATECRNDIVLLTSNLISVVAVVVSSFPHDLEIIAKVATLFIVWTTYTNGQLIGVDPDLTTTYKSVLEHFVELCRDTIENGDSESRNRKRLLGLAALTAVVTSDALYHPTAEFKAQVSIIIPSILRTLRTVSVDVLFDESSTIRQQPSVSSSYIADFPPRPLKDRRAVSIHIHIDEENGPSASTVVIAALRTMHTLLDHSNARQILDILQAIFEDAENEHWWNNLGFCRWLALALIDWLPYQHRYMVAKKLLDSLTAVQDSSTSLDKYFAITGMINTVFTSPTPLVNLSTSDMLSCLLSLLLRRVAIDPTDSLLTHLVECISALGTHVYYQDQIHDLVEELIGRLISLQVNGILGRGRVDKEPNTNQGLRSLLSSLKGLFATADKHDNSTSSIPPLGDRMASASSGRQSIFTVDGATPKPSRRTHVPPEVWQDSLALLCEVDYGVRSEYASILLWFVRKEIVEEPFALTSSDSDDTIVPRRPTPGMITSDPILRFLNALHASIYNLATSSSLGISWSPSASVHSSNLQLSSLPAVNVTGATPNGSFSGRSEENLDGGSLAGSRRVSLSQTEYSNTQEGRTSFSASGPRFRKPSLPLNLLERGGNQTGSSPAATLSDYMHLSDILITVHERVPGHSLLAGVPMLLALQSFALHRTNETNGFDNEKRFAILELTIRIWEVIGKVWECEEVIAITKKIKANLPTSLLSHNLSGADAERPIPWSPIPTLTKEFSTYAIDPELVVQALASNRNAQVVTGLDRQQLLRRLGQAWTLESALNDSVEQPSTHDSLRTGGVSPFTKFSPTLMHIENLSLQSLAKAQNGVGANDLREALEGRGSSTNLVIGTRPSSIRTFDQSTLNPRERLGLARSSTHRSGSTSSSNVQNMLDELGIGKNKADRMLKASFHIPNRNKTKTPSIPPYSA